MLKLQVIKAKKVSTVSVIFGFIGSFSCLRAQPSPWRLIQHRWERSKLRSSSSCRRRLKRVEIPWRPRILTTLEILSLGVLLLPSTQCIRHRCWSSSKDSPLAAINFQKHPQDCQAIEGQTCWDSSKFRKYRILSKFLYAQQYSYWQPYDCWRLGNEESGT